MKIYASLNEDVNEGHVWLKREDLPSRGVVKIRNPRTRQSVFCEALQIDDNFLLRYNRPPRLSINSPESSIVMNGWYRACLGGLETERDYSLEIASQNPFYGAIRASLDHPQNTVRVAVQLGVLSVVLAVLSILLAVRVELYEFVRSMFRPDAATGVQSDSAPPTPVFLGTNYGMTTDQVRIALRGEGAQLLSYTDYVQVETNPLIKKLDLRPLYSEDRVNETVLYMPSVQIWNSRVEAEFTFKKDLLTSIAAYLEAVDQPSEAVVNLVDKELRRRYAFKGRTESTEVPGAYSLDFLDDHSRKASFWVNLADKQKPILIAYFFDGSVLDAEKRRIQQRQQRALGPAKR